MTEAASANGSGTKAPARRVVVVEGGELFHRAGCALVTDKDSTEVTPTAARKKGLRPCPACAPAPAPLTAR
jgi:hypothetical protein